MITKHRIIGAVEIGSSKIIVLVGEVVEGRSLQIIGMGQCPSQGVSKGSVVDFKLASECATAALVEAEKSARAKMEGAFLAITGGHLDGFANEGVVNVAAADNVVTAADVQRARQLATSKQLPPERSVVHEIRRGYRLDGRPVSQPEHLEGRRLEADYWIVHGLKSKLADNFHLINAFNIEVKDVILSSLASGTMVTGPEDRQQGCLVMDMGAGTTDYVLYRDGAIQCTGVVTVGGAHFTNDLSIGLRVSTAQAEMLKVKHGRGVAACRDKAEEVWLNGDQTIGDRLFPLLAVEQVTEARAGELMDVVRRRLGEAWVPERAGAGVVLTGGASRLAGMDEAAARVFGVPARCGENPSHVAEDLRKPEFSTALGLLHYSLNYKSSGAAARQRIKFIDKIARMFSGA